MGLFDFFKSKLGMKSMDSSVPSSYPAGLLWGDIDSTSGQTVTEWTALRQAAVLQCITVLSNGVAQIPFRLMKEGNTVADEHPLYWLFKESPNKWQSSFEFWQMIMLHLALQGECIVWKVSSRGVIQRLIPFAPTDCTTTEDYDSQGFPVRTYHLLKPNGSTVDVPERDIWHLRWREYALRIGLPQMQLAQSVVGIALAGDKFSGTSLKNGATLSGILTAKQQMSPEQQKLLQESWEKNYGGAGNANKTVVIGADLGYQPLGQTNTDAQIIDQRKFAIEDICRAWNVNPLMVFYMDNTASYGNSEQMMIQHVTHTMAPWYRMLEESAYVNLLTEEERRKQGLYFAFNDNALLRADSKSRADYYRSLFNIGAITPNEIREKEDMVPMDGGDKLYVQGAIVPIEDAGKWENNSPANEGASESPSVPKETSKEPEGNNNG